MVALRAIFFSSRKDAEAQRNCGPLGLTSGGLCGLATLRAKYFFLFLAKTQSRKEIVPNSLRLPYFAACPPRRTGLAALQPAPQNYGAPYSFFAFFFRKGAKRIVVVK